VLLLQKFDGNVIYYYYNSSFKVENKAKAIIPLIKHLTGQFENL